MIKLLFLALLCSFAFQQTVLLNSDPTNTIITSPAGKTVAAEPYHNSNNANFLGSGAKWIWQTGGSSWPDNLTLVFQTQFYAACNGAANLTITADNTFSVVLNGGGAPLTGNDWRQKYSFPLGPLKCGKNVLVITVVNRDKNSPAALVFSVTQDQSTCFKCLTPLSSFNRETCQCECHRGCNCGSINSLYVWQNYPVCGCACGFEAKCNELQYFNKRTCACQCNPVSCLQGQQQDKKTCLCKKRCPVQLIKFACKPNQFFSVEQCKCVCKPCLPGFFQKDSETCECVRRNIVCNERQCPKGKIWSKQANDCICAKNLVCIATMRWSQKLCACVPINL